MLILKSQKINAKNAMMDRISKIFLDVYLLGGGHTERGRQKIPSSLCRSAQSLDLMNRKVMT